MCGLMGYCGREMAAPHIVAGLRRLEYRGYDSAGVATIFDRVIHFRKDSGKLAEVEQKHGLMQLPGNTGIGHVRWATHGSPTQVNAHPHLGCSGNIAVVHNGIVENWHELAMTLG
jgi:glutamine---fructose-6-phosphate transaminase (isomerizing)